MGLACPECQKKLDADELHTVCEDCDSPLFAQYDLSSIAYKVDRGQFSQRARGMWRWAELLPVRDPAYRFSLGEGDTPLLRLLNLERRLGPYSLFLKDEGLNPTGTFKARGLAVGVSRAAELGVRGVVIPTAGNAGGAMAAYAARGGLAAQVYMPADAPVTNLLEVEAAGAELGLVDGLINDAGREAQQKAATPGWFALSTFREPYRVEGKKTMGLELAEAFGWELPEVIIYPTGGGTGLVGMWKAFDELEELGWVGEERPRFVSVQSSGCAPVVRAFEARTERVEPWEDAETVAHGLRVPQVYADRLVLRVLRKSEGTAVAVRDEDILNAQADLAREEGILACPEGAATLAALQRLAEAGELNQGDRVVLFNTGAGLKYLK